MTSSEPGAPPSSPGSEPTASPNDAAHPALQGPEPSSGLSEEIFRDPAEGTLPLGHHSSVPVGLPETCLRSVCVEWWLQMILLQAAGSPDYKWGSCRNWFIKMGISRRSL